MPSAGKIESYTVHCEKGRDHFNTKAAQPRWLLRNKTYKPLAPGLPDYAIGKDWLPQIAQNPQSTGTHVRLRQSHLGVMDTFKNAPDMSLKRESVHLPPRSYTAPASVERATMLPRQNYQYGSRLVKMSDLPAATEVNMTARVAAPKVDHMKAQMMGQASTARKISDISRYFEELGHARVGQLLRDRQGGLECIRT